jgi:hypothetical protein
MKKSKYRTLSSLYQAIAQGKVDLKGLIAMADGGDFTVYRPAPASSMEEDEVFFDGHERDAIKFAAKMLGVRYVEP